MKFGVDDKFKLVFLHRQNLLSKIYWYFCRSLCMDFLPPSGGVFRLALARSSPSISCRRSCGFQGSMKVCRKHTITKKKVLGSIPSGFQWISGESQGETGRNASAFWKMLWIEHTIITFKFLGSDTSAFCLQNRK